MNADNTQLQNLLNKPTHFLIPLFQRTYSWDKNDWETLWADVLETYDSGIGGHHFLGSIVSKSLPSTPEGVGRFLVIDGQQRLTTLTILLAALRDAVRPTDATLADKLHNLYLTNSYETGRNRFKVMPTKANQGAYFTVIEESNANNVKTENGNVPLVRQAYDFFRDELGKQDHENQPIDLRRLQQVVLGGFELVSITLGEDDNEFRIFESLNAKGAPLAQSDLLRNYLFMRLPESGHDAAYHELWLPMQEALRPERLDDFIRYTLLGRGQFVREGDVYQEWKRILDKQPPDGVLACLRDLAREGRFYHRLVEPENEPHVAISGRLRRLNRWGGQTMYPFLLNVYDWYDEGKVNDEGVEAILEMVESFLVRRLFANIPTNALNRLFVRLAHQLPEGHDKVEGVQVALSDPGRRWPRDDEFRAAILSYPLYLDSRPEQRRVILETLEQSFPHKEAPSLENVSIEHVMPQTLTSSWRASLGAHADNTHRRLLHVLGNLTLSAYNQELGNAPFGEKRQRYAGSNLHLNRQIAQATEWTAAQIEERGRRLAERLVSIWPGPL